MASRKIASTVSTQWLKGQLSRGMNNNRILDASWTVKKSGHDDFISGHIPGALFFDLDRCVNPLRNLPRNLPNPSCFAEYVQTLGINQDSHVILYDRGNLTPSSRLWWNFKAYGHDDVSVLEGGMGKWMSEGHDIETGLMSLPMKLGNFKVNIRTKYIRKYEDMQEIVKSNSHQIVDTRKAGHFAGREPEPSHYTKSGFETFSLAPLDAPMMRGHIPGAVNLHKTKLMDEETNCLLPKEALKEVFHSAGVDLSKPVVSMCYGGYSACIIALAAFSCGQEDVAVYYGSWTEYGYRTDADGVVSGSGEKEKSGG